MEPTGRFWFIHITACFKQLGWGRQGTQGLKVTLGEDLCSTWHSRKVPSCATSCVLV